MKKLLLVLASLLLALPLAAAPPARDSEYQQAHLAYREARYQAAYDGYERLLGTAGADGHLLYNLGNAAFRLNQIGRAILFYEKARVLLPRDADLKFNLGHAREQIRDVIPEAESFVDTALFWLGSLTLAEFFWCFALANVLFWGILAIRIYSRTEWTYSLIFLLLGFWLLAGISFGVKWQQTRTDDRAVVLQTEVSVLAGPDRRDTLLFRLREGTVVHLERSEEGWSLVRLSDGRRGWLRTESSEWIASRSPGWAARRISTFSRFSGCTNYSSIIYLAIYSECRWTIPRPAGDLIVFAAPHSFTFPARLGGCRFQGRAEVPMVRWCRFLPRAPPARGYRASRAGVWFVNRRMNGQKGGRS
jgi:hypothetical protein